MGIRINLGGLFSLFFGRKKHKKETVENESSSISWEPLTADAVLNCCEQVGAFDKFNLEENSPVINAVCEAVAQKFNERTDKSVVALKDSFRQGFAANSLNVSENVANTFVDAYLSSYVYNN